MISLLYGMNDVIKKIKDLFFHPRESPKLKEKINWALVHGLSKHHIT